MAAGRRKVSCFSAFSVLGLLVVCFHRDVEADKETEVIHKKVGETVEFNSRALAQDVTYSYWKYERLSVQSNEQFKDRISHNKQNYSLTVRDLTVRDSGNYIFVSEVNGQQRPTVMIKLLVHEPITHQPRVSVISITRDESNQSCTVSLKCNTSVRNVSYRWTVGSRTQNGSELHHTIWPQDGEIKFSCTISNYFEEKSSSVIQECSNSTVPDGSDSWQNKDQETAGAPSGSHQLVLYVAGGISTVILVITVAAVAVYCFKRKQAGIDDDQTVYAHVSDVKQEDPYSEYETIHPDHPVTPAVNTVYDKVQLHRLGPKITTNYQDIS